MGPIKSILIFGALAFSSAAFSQWQWLDKDGRKVFSDRPPPADVAEKNIIKSPYGASRPAAAAPAAQASRAASEPALKITGTDPALEEKKKQAEAADAAKKKQEAQQLVAARNENCQRAKDAKAAYDSGMRIARVNSQGEREILDDAAREAETRRLQSVINSDCR